MSEKIVRLLSCSWANVRPVPKNQARDVFYPYSWRQGIAIIFPPRFRTRQGRPVPPAWFMGKVQAVNLPPQNRKAQVFLAISLCIRYYIYACAMPFLSGKGGDKMSMDAIKLVAESEEKARQVRSAAQAQAQALVDQAAKDGQARLDQARKEAQARARELLAQVEDQGEETTREALAEYEKDCEALKAKAAQRLDKAAELIVGRVVRS